VGRAFGQFACTQQAVEWRGRGTADGYVVHRYVYNSLANPQDGLRLALESAQALVQLGRQCNMLKFEDFVSHSTTCFVLLQVRS
jgi:hypothetical protein